MSRTDPETTWLPLTAPAAAGAEASAREAELVSRLVHGFYGAARRDDVLGPVFERYVRDWPAHLERMERFWASAVFRAGTYSGRPLEAHRGIAELTPTHFERWLALWRRTVSQQVPEPEAARFIALAERMATAIRSRLSLAARRDG